MTEIDYNLFPMHRSSWSSGNARKYNDMIDEIRELAVKKFEVPEWSNTVEYVNRFAVSEWNRYPKITPNAWKAHLRIEEELEIRLFPALFVSTFPVKDAGEVSWWMYDINGRAWGSANHLRDILKKKYKLVVEEFDNIGCQLKGIGDDK